MIDKKTHADEAAQLRRQAEELYLENTAALPQEAEVITPEAMRLSLHELGVHQIELEMQNEELRRSQLEVGVQRARYFDLYNLAPVGYLTLNEKGLILEANLTAAGLLGVARGALIRHPLSQFVLNEDQDIYYRMRKQLLETREPLSYELRMLRHESRTVPAEGKGGTTIYVHLTVSGVEDSPTPLTEPDAGELPVFRVVLSEISERKRVEQALTESETNFRNFFEAIDDMIVVATLGGNILFGNAALKHKLGYTPEDLSCMHVLDLNPADERQEAEAIFAAMFRGERTSCPLPLVAKNKTLVPAETRAWTGKWNGLDCLFGVSKDLSVEQEAQQRFERLFRNNPALMALSSYPEHRFMDVNDIFLATMGYNPEEMLGKTSAEIGLFLKPQQQAAIIEQLQSNGRISGIELQVRCKDGSVLDGLFSGDSIRSQGKDYYLTVMVNMTERKQAQEALRKSEAKYRRLFESAAIGIFHSSLAGRFLDVNPAMARMLGYDSPQEVIDSIYSISEEVFADPPQRAKMIKNGFAQGEVLVAENRYRRKDGTLWTGNLTMRQVPDLHGQPQFLDGFVEDITERKRMADALRETEEFIHAALDALSAHVAILDENGFILSVNRAWRDFALANAGETTHLCEGINYLALCDAAHGPDSEEGAAFAAGMRAVLQGKLDEFVLEYPCHSPNEKRWFNGRVTHFTSKGVLNLVVAHENITVRKLKEDEVVRVNAELEQRVLDRTTDLAHTNRLLEEKVAEVLEDQKSLQQGRDKLEQLFELLPVGVSVLDQQERIVKMNPALKTILGLTNEGLSAGQYKNRRHFRPDGSPMPFEEFASKRVFNGEKQASQVETGVEKEDGSLVWIDVSAVAGHFEDWSTVIVTTDITQRRQAEDEIRGHTARAETLVRTGAALAADLDLKNMLQTVCLEAARVLKAPAANIFLSDARDVELTLAGSFGLPADFSQRSQSFPKTLIEQIAARQGIDRIGVLPIAQFLNQPNIQLFSEMGMQSVICVKMMHDQKLVGLLSVFSPEEAAHFSAADQGLLLGLADQVAQAVVNIRLFEQVNAGKQHLRKLSQALIDMEENERRSLALELHDQLGQMLSTVKMSLDMISMLPQAAASEQLQQAGKLVGDMISRVRRMALDLRPSILDDRGLLPALLYLFKSFKIQNGEAVTFKHKGLGLRFPPKVEITGYRIIQEALTNIQRHAGKTDVYVNIWANDQSLNLQIRDFGVGFDPAVSLKGVSSGLSGMRERARLLGGELVIESAPCQGTTVTAMLPVMLIQENT